MTLAAVAPPLIAYALAFQAVVYLLLPHRRRSTWAPVTTGAVGAGLIVAAATIFGPAELGLSPGRPLDAVLWGLAAGLCCVIGGVALLGTEKGRRWLADPRASRISSRQAVATFLIRIPLLTALVEEALFRGLLHAVLVSLYPIETAVLLGAALFGLWHVAPGLERARAGGGDRRIHITLTVLSTTVAGLFLVWLRVETGSIWAPAAVHAAVNMTMTLFARAAFNRAPAEAGDSLPACTYAVSSFGSPVPSQEVPSGSA